MLRIFRHYVSTAALSLLLLDTLVIFAILLGVLSTEAFGLKLDPAGRAGLAAMPTAMILILMFSTGAYDKANLDNYRHLSSRLSVCLVLSIILFVAVYMLGWQNQPALLTSSNLFYGAALLGVYPAILGTRAGYLYIWRRYGSPRRILVLGAGPVAARIEGIAKQDLNLSSEIIGYADVGDEPVKVSQSKVVSVGPSLADAAASLGVNEIVVSLQNRRGMPMQQLLECRMRGIRVSSVLNFWERETRSVMLDALDPSWLVYSEGFELNSLVNAALKRMFDIFVAVVFLAFMLPVLAIAGLAVKLDSRGPVFYRQERVGRNGRVFTLFKLRTMRQDAEKEGAPQWAAARDPRVTKVGAFLRLTRIDEIPQIINVLRGDMSIVGPRPERPYFVDLLAKEIPYYRERLRLRPGITGWAQISYPYGASIEDARAKLSYDLYYIKNFSILFDFLTMFATVQVVLWNKGAR